MKLFHMKLQRQTGIVSKVYETKLRDKLSKFLSNSQLIFSKTSQLFLKRNTTEIPNIITLSLVLPVVPFLPSLVTKLVSFTYVTLKTERKLPGEEKTVF